MNHCSPSESLHRYQVWSPTLMPQGGWPYIGVFAAQHHTDQALFHTCTWLKADVVVIPYAPLPRPCKAEMQLLLVPHTEDTGLGY